MATPLSADRLVAALRAEGVRVVEYRDWRIHNRNHVGTWGPVHGVMVHHTVTSGTDGSVALCYDGHSKLPGPLCHGVIAKDGTVYLVGNGRANHAGAGDPDVLRAVIAEEPLPPDNEATADGNRHFYGFECVNLGDGKDPWPAVQVDAMVRASAALCRVHGWGGSSVIGHLEWQPGKVDPRPSPGGDDVRMDTIRARIAERLQHPAGWTPAGTSTTSTAPQEDDMPVTQEDADRIAEAVWRRTVPVRGADLAADSVLRRAYTNALDSNRGTATLTAQVGALTAAVTALAQSGGLDAAEVLAVAEAGAQAALDRLAQALTENGQ